MVSSPQNLHEKSFLRRHIFLGFKQNISLPFFKKIILLVFGPKDSPKNPAAQPNLSTSWFLWLPHSGGPDDGAGQMMWSNIHDRLNKKSWPQHMLHQKNQQINNNVGRSVKKTPVLRLLEKHQKTG